MKWHSRLRWKLFISHVVIVVIADLVLLATAFVIARSGLVETPPLTLGEAAAETGQLTPGDTSPLPPSRQFEVVIQQGLLLSGFAALTAAVIVSLFVSRRIVEPLTILSTVSRRLAQGYYRERTEIESDDEIAELSRSVNQLADALDRTEQRRLSLLADVTHELRTPLSTIGGYMEGMIDGIVKPERTTFSLILRETTRLQRLIEDLELLSRVEAGQLPVIARSIDLRSLLEQMLAQFHAAFAANNVHLDLIAPDNLPRAWADPDRVQQIVVNLLGNAIRYTPSGGTVSISVRLQDDRLMLVLRDSGEGIAAEHLPHIFERFYRVDKSRARQSGGSGIGLAIVRHLVYAHGGEIWATSDGPGTGTSFTFTLPISVDQPRNANEASATPTQA